MTASGSSTAAREYAVLADGRLVRWKDKELLDTGYKAVSFAENRYMGLKTDGTLWAWGEWYSLSDHTIEKPVKVLSNVKQISGYLALKKDGSVWSPEPLESMNQKQDGIFYQVIDGGVVQISNFWRMPVWPSQRMERSIAGAVIGPMLPFGRSTSLIPEIVRPPFWNRSAMSMDILRFGRTVRCGPGVPTRLERWATEAAVR